MNETVTAHLRYLRITPRKTRFVADVIRGLPVLEAEAQLMILTRRATDPLLKLLRSAVANAKTQLKMAPDALFVKEIRVNHGPKLKRFTPRSRGSSNKIEKKMSHVSIVLGILLQKTPSRFVIDHSTRKEREKVKRESQRVAKKPKVKQQEKTEAAKELPKETTPPVQVTKGRKAAKEPGVFKKVFQRKAV